VADVQVAVGLGRETRDDLGVTLFRDMLGDDVADEIARGRRGGAVFSTVITRQIAEPACRRNTVACRAGEVTNNTYQGTSNKCQEYVCARSE